MGTVSVNPPKTPVTKGNVGVAAATVPNVCKMPGPPAPFVPTPLPNIGTSDDSPQGYSTSVKMEGQPVAITGSSFNSKGDIASKGTGGGIVSSNAHGPTKFVAPGALMVKIEGKNTQYLGDQMLNNCGPGGSPPNSATMGGVITSPLPPGTPAPGDADPCDHEWEQTNPGKTPADAAKANDDQIADNAGKPSMDDKMRGLAFENKAVADNQPKMDIQSVGAVYKCKKCGQEQEVDVVGKKQVAEAKSRTYKGVKGKSKQARRVRDIQHKMFDPTQNPLAKLDGSMADHADSTKKYLERGFNVEVL